MEKFLKQRFFVNGIKIKPVPDGEGTHLCCGCILKDPHRLCSDDFFRAWDLPLCTGGPVMFHYEEDTE